MSLTGVKVAEEVWLTCLTHALSTEAEEVMGLLLGDIEYLSDGSATALVWGAAPQTRSDRRKDRVETNPEQLAAATAQAEIISASTGRTTRVIGWYHSHPHITVFPSHVDVRTQGMYQMLDPGFVGLIFSCFSEDSNKVGRIQVVAFQASDGRRKNTVDVSSSFVKGGNMTSSLGHELVRTGSAFSMPTSSSERSDGTELEIISPSTASTSKGGNEPQSHTMALGELFANVDNELGVEGNPGNNVKILNENAGTVQNNDINSLDLTVGMQEAMHRSNLDLSGAEFTRKEVPLQVVPGHTLAKLDFPLSSFVNLQQILFDEERSAYNHAMSQSTWKGKVHPLAGIHHSATYQASLCKLIEYCLSPVLSSLWDKLQQNKIRLLSLQEEATNLQLQSFVRGNTMLRRSSGSGVRGSTHTSSSERRAANNASSPTTRKDVNVNNQSGSRGSPEGKAAGASDLMMF